jgi:molybdopterin molybdotransferase
MDGFAVLSTDVVNAKPNQPVTLNVVADIPAGQSSKVSVKPGQSARITTGAPMPNGTDAVVPVEETDFNYRDSGTPAPSQVKIYRSVKKNEYIRPKGQDVQKGDVILTPKCRLRPQDLGMLAMLGEAKVSVFRKPRVGLLSTGDELLPVGTQITPGKIYDSNAYTLTALVERYGGDPIDLGISADRAEAVKSQLEQAVQNDVDLIISSAGVSVGAFDFVRSVVDEHGHLNFWRVNMRPGKPLVFGNYRNIPFFGLPGNPVSAFVGFEVFIRPALLKLAGLEIHTRKSHPVELTEKIESDGRESYLRGIVEEQNGHWVAVLTGHQGSGNLLSLVQANALLIVPAGVTSLPPGAIVQAWFLNDESVML